MARSTTPSFVTELPLKTTSVQEAILLKRLDAARRVYNACLGESLKRARVMRQAAEHKVARALPAGEPKSAKRKARAKAFRQLRKTHEFDEYALHNYAKQFGYSYLGDHLDAQAVQKVATRAFNAVNEYVLGKRGKPRFKGHNQFDSVEGKCSICGIRWVENSRVEWNTTACKLTLEPVIPDNDPVIDHGLSCRVKYVRIVRRKLNGRNRFYVQLVNEGLPYRKEKNTRGSGIVGMDLGPQTIALVSDETAELRVFVAELERRDKEIASLQRHIERQRRANNPDNYQPDRWVRSKTGKRWIRKKGKPKKGRHKWHISNRQRENERRLSELHRKQAEHRKSLHGNLVNHILRLGDHFKMEKVSYKAWQRTFGRSVGFRAPGTFASLLRRKAESAGGRVDEFPTRTTRLSQTCLCGAIEKKPLSERWHDCSCGLLMQRDLFSGFLARCVENDLLNANKARETWLGLESVLWAALSSSSIESVNGKAALPASAGLSQRQNGSPRKPDGINVKSHDDELPLILHLGNGVVMSGTPRL